MFRLFGDTNINFMGARRVWAVISLLVIATSIGLVAVKGLRLGVEFQGGAEVVLQFKQVQDLAAVRAVLADGGFEGVQVTTVSTTTLEVTGQGIQAPAEEGTGLQIKVPLPDDADADPGGLAESVIRTLRAARSAGADDRPDINTMGAAALRELLSAGGTIPEDETRRAADAILAYRRIHCGLISGFDTMVADAGVRNEISERVERTMRQNLSIDFRADLNTIDRNDLACFLRERGSLAEDEADRVAGALLGFRDDHRGVIEGLAVLDAEPAMADVLTPQVRTVLESQAEFGEFARRSNDFIGSQVSGEMRLQAISAILLSLAGMFTYIWLRFKGPQWGLAAILAVTHDVAITFGFFVAYGMEATLPVVAAFLTLVGYSVNDTIVVFDRIRENQRASRSRSFVDTINQSINQTLSRTVLTSGTTWVVVLSLFLFGGAVIHGFAFVLLVGVLVGTYSSIYVASPLLLFWQRLLGERRRTREAEKRTRAAKGGY